MQRGIGKKDVADQFGAGAGINHGAGLDDVAQTGVSLNDHQRTDLLPGKGRRPFHQCVYKPSPALSNLALIHPRREKLQFSDLGAPYLFECAAQLRLKDHDHHHKSGLQDIFHQKAQRPQPELGGEDAHQQQDLNSLDQLGCASLPHQFGHLVEQVRNNRDVKQVLRQYRTKYVSQIVP